MTSPTDKRRSPRVPVDFDVRFTFGNREHQAKALNLSADGMFIKTDYMLLQNDVVEIFFHLPDAPESLWMKGRVVWGSRVEGQESSISGMGVQFLEPLPEQKDSVERYLRALLKS